MPTSIIAKATKLEKLRADVARLELEIAIDLRIVSTKPLLAAPKPAAAGPVAKVRHRATITPAMRAKAMRLTAAGKSRNQIAARLGISTASVSTIRQQAKAKAI